jgi:hypothetical protein
VSRFDLKRAGVKFKKLITPSALGFFVFDVIYDNIKDNPNEYAEILEEN